MPEERTIVRRRAVEIAAGRRIGHKRYSILD
jgi:hypothetical protein